MTVEVDRISVAINTSGVTWTMATDIFNVFWQHRAFLQVFFTKLRFIVFMVRCFFLLDYFLANVIF